MTGAAPRPDGWPDPNDRNCDRCGHVWFARERRHEYADTSVASAKDTAVLCILCRQKQRPAPDEE